MIRDHLSFASFQTQNEKGKHTDFMLTNSFKINMFNCVVKGEIDAWVVQFYCCCQLLQNILGSIIIPSLTKFYNDDNVIIFSIMLHPRLHLLSLFQLEISQLRYSCDVAFFKLHFSSITMFGCSRNIQEHLGGFSEITCAGVI